MTDARGGEMNRIRLMPDYDALLVPKQIAIITESVQALNDICVSLETENAAIRTAAENLMDAIENSKRTINHRTQVTDVYFEMESSLTELKAALEAK